uniref:Uncharacterized protein n=1 Tax=Ixodes ricinus TaxID=34613 RepID=A0A147BV19_IXORI
MAQTAARVKVSRALSFTHLAIHPFMLQSATAQSRICREFGHSLGSIGDKCGGAIGRKRAGRVPGRLQKFECDQPEARNNALAVVARNKPDNCIRVTLDD